MNLKSANFLFLLLFSFNTNAQIFDKYKDNVNQCKVIRYYKIDYQLALEKRIPFDSTAQQYYVIGVYLDKPKTSIIDVLMRSGGTIKLENGIKINLLDDINVYNQGGPTEVLAIKHQLTMDEFEILKINNIEYFSILGVKKDFDKYQRNHISEAINSLISEKF